MTSESFNAASEAADNLTNALGEVAEVADETAKELGKLAEKAKRPVRRRKADTTAVNNAPPDAKPIRVCLYPRAEGEDPGQGGVRRVIEAQQRYLPEFGVELVDDPALADVLASHISFPPEWVKLYPDKAFVLHCHGLYWAEYEWPGWALTANSEVMEGIRVADAVTVPSLWIRDVIAKHTCREARIIAHGVDLDEFSPYVAPRGEDGKLVEIPPYVLWDKTRPDPVCDPSVVNAVAALLPEVQFVTTFGEPAPNVTVVGHQTYDSARNLIRNAAVYLATSRETFGIATLQALACGVPVAGYAWGAQPEILNRDLDSYLARPGDVEGLAEGIRWLLKRHDEASIAARETATYYAWEPKIGEYAELYREVLANRREVRPRVSIVVTAYMLEKYLLDCLNSVAGQPFTDWECIVVDDASRDRCGEIADNFAANNSQFRVIHNPTNRYQAGARNAGIAVSRGRYILPLDADDMLTPGAVQILADQLDRDRSIHVAYGNVRFVQEDGETLMTYPKPDGTMHEAGHSGWPFPFNWNHQRQGYNLLPYSSMFRREAWEQTGGYRERLRNDDDPDFWLRVSSYGWRPKMVTSADTLIYRVRADSMSRTVPHGDWARWFGWKSSPLRSPAGAVTDDGKQLPVPSWQPPAISVVIPVGPGHERHVMTAIDSLEAQTMGWFEAIVVNDTGGPLPPMPPWVRVIRNPGKGPKWASGAAGSRNLGAEAARARLLLFLDADDYLQPEALQIWFDAAKSRPGVIWYADMWEDPHEAGKFQLFEWPDADARNLTRGCVGALTQLIPREVFQAVGGFEDKPWEDWRFFLKAASLGVCSARIARPLWTYRKHTGMRRNNALIGDRYLDGKAAVLEDFGQYFAADRLTAPKEDLMACGCAKAQTATYALPSEARMLAAAPEGAVLMRYRGDKLAGVQYNGPSGQSYTWSSDTPAMYVLSADVAYFDALADFERAVATPEGYGPSPTKPELVA